MPAAKPKFPQRPIQLTYDVRQATGYNESTGAMETQRLTVACIVDANSIRTHYPRHSGHPGTRITFMDGGGFAVMESFEQVTSLLYGDADIPFCAPIQPPSQQLEHQPDEVNENTVDAD